MKTQLYTSSSRGTTDLGWLESYHSFSFGTYQDAKRIHFGALRVLNDDTVAPGKGFGMHRHQHMEIISIPLSGDLEHHDSLGNRTHIKTGDVQVMSAGTGIEHSEYNKNKDIPVSFLQIWIIPNRRDVAPRYDQITLPVPMAHNQWQQILSPDPNDEGVWIYQEAWFYLGIVETGHTQEYTLKNLDNGIYVFCLEGSVSIENHTLHQRDGLAIWDSSSAVVCTATTTARLLLMEIPLHI